MQTSTHAVARTFEDACRAQDMRITQAQIAALPEATPMVAEFGECCGEHASCADCAKAQARADRFYC